MSGTAKPESGVSSAQASGDRVEPSRLTVIRQVVEIPQAHDEDRDRDCHREPGAGGAHLRVMRRLIDADRQPRTDGRGGGEDQVVTVPPHDGLPRLVSRSCTGRSKYILHIEYAISSPPTMIGKSGERASPEASAACTARVAARIESAQHDESEQPIASAMCWGCHVVGVVRSARTGTVSSSAKRTKNPGRHRWGIHSMPTHASCRREMPAA